MIRKFIGDLLQTIYLDICITEDSYIYKYEHSNNQMFDQRFHNDFNNLDTIFYNLEKMIHPRYTKVIIDANPDTTKFITKWIDNKYNQHITKTEILLKDGSLKVFPETMLEMVQVVKYHPKKINITNKINAEMFKETKQVILKRMGVQ